MPSAGKRPNGDGTIYQRKDGRWEAALMVTGPGGVRVRRRVYAASRREVRAKLTELQRNVDQGLPVAVGRETVESYLQAWLVEVVRRRRKPRTAETYELLVRRHIVPTLGRVRLDRLTARQVRLLLDAKIEEGLSGSTVRQIHAVLRAALELAVREDVLPRNVARLVEVPTGPVRRVDSMNVDEARRFLEAARTDRLYAFWAVALGVGLRKGEALGLRWEDVDLEAGELYVRKSLQRIDGSLVLDDLKTAKSRRTLALPPVCVEALRAHRERQMGERNLLGPAWHESGLVFTTQLGTAIDPRNVNRWFERLCDRAEVRRMRVHDLRRTCATLLLAQGVPARVVMEVLGHSQISMTMNIYTDVLPEVQREASQRMQNALGGPLPSRLPSKDGLA